MYSKLHWGASLHQVFHFFPVSPHSPPLSFIRYPELPSSKFAWIAPEDHIVEGTSAEVCAVLGDGFLPSYYEPVPVTAAEAQRLTDNPARQGNSAAAGAFATSGLVSSLAIAAVLARAFY